MKTSVTAVTLLIFCLAVTESQARSFPIPCDRGKDHPHVAFAATLGIRGHCGPFGKPTTLVYKHVYYNSGAYNPATGVFTAPVRGAYYLSFSGHNLSSRSMGLQMMKNGKHTITVFNHRQRYRPRFETATNGITLLLEVGDHVSMTLMRHTWIFDNQNFHSTFVGHLLFPL